jgi:hypothetical protein
VTVKSPAFLWRLSVTVALALIWAAWFWVVNGGQEIQFWPNGSDLARLNTVMSWFPWARIVLIVGFIFILALIRSFVKESKEKEKNDDSLFFIGIVVVIAGLDMLVGWLIFPWGLSLTLSVFLLPGLTLIRPYRDWKTSLAVSLVDFYATRMIFVCLVIAIHADEVYSESSWWWVLYMRILGYAVLAGGLAVYAYFVKRSISMYNPFHNLIA